VTRWHWLGVAVALGGCTEGGKVDAHFDRMPGVAVESAAATAIVDVPQDRRISPATVSATEPPDYPRRFGTPEQNSRLGTALPAGPWRARFRTPLRGVERPRDVLVLGDRVAVRADESFALFDLDGEAVAAAPIGDGAILLDPIDSLLLAVASDGLLTGWNLADGERRFRMILLLPGDHTRVFLDRPDDLILASVETRVPPHTDRKPSQSVVERYSLGAPIEVDRNGALLSGRRTGELVRDRSDLAIARHGNRLVLAIEDSILRADPPLALDAELTGRFRPRALSLDESGRVYLVADTEAGTSLSAVEPDGRRLFETPLLSARSTLLAPPIVSHHHLTYLVFGDRVLAFERDGRPSWQIGGAIAGATLTADDALLVAIGSEIRVVRTGGPGDLVVKIPEPVRTPPVLSAGGFLLFASADTLYAFEPVPRGR